jgi:O-antigen/teichoic acid export membrane protein
MGKKSTILRNSMFLTVQPLLLNLISLIVIGYIARKLGKSDFGIFNFVTTFTMLLYPLAVMGLNRITVRDLASIDDKSSYASKMIPARILTSLIAIVFIIIATYILDYSRRTTVAMYLACSIFFFQLLSESLTDIFNSMERMEFTAMVGMISGLTLTLLSFIVLYIGFGLFELIGVYAFGQMIGCILALYFMTKFFLHLRIQPSWSFITEKVKDGFQFFLMTMMWFSMLRLDTIILSKKVSMSELGVYTSAMLLVTRLAIIPNAFASSLLPAISHSYSKHQMSEISNIANTFITNIILLILPCVIVVSFFSYDIIELIFGFQFRSAGIILRITIWTFLLNCIAFTEFSILTGIRKENVLLRSYIISTLYCVMSNLLFIHYFGTVGAAFAFFSTQLILVLLFSHFSYKYVAKLFNLDSIVRIILLNLGLILLLYLLRVHISFWSIFVGSVFYLVGALFLRLITIQEIFNLKKLFIIS